MLPLDWQKKVSPERITRIHFYCTAANHPEGQVFVIDRLSLLKEGEAEPPPPQSPSLARDVVPMVEGIRAAETAANAEAGTELGHLRDYVRFCRESAASPFRSFDMAVGTATSMEKVRPRAGFKSSPIAQGGLRVRLARNEYESVQLLVAPVGGDLRGVRVAVDCDLGSFAASNVSVCAVGYVNVTNRPPYSVGYDVPKDGEPGYERKWREPEQGWWPDSIIRAVDGVDVRGTDVQSFWVRVHCPEGQAAGEYRGSIVVSAVGMEPIRIPLAVRVNDFAIGRAAPLPLAVSFCPIPKGWNSWFYEARKIPCSAISVWEKVAAKKRKDEWCDFLADYFITWHDLYTRKGFDTNLVARLRDQGRLGRFNLGVWVTPQSTTNEAHLAKWRESHLPRIREAYEKAKALGVLDHAYIYGCDEVTGYEKFQRMASVIDELKAAAPGVPVMTSALDWKLGVGSPLKGIDGFVQLTRDYTEMTAKAREASRKAGHKVWWYVCAGPYAPRANMFIEGQGIEPRLLMGAQTLRMSPDGFLYYQTAIWKSKHCIGSEPFTEWNPVSYVIGSDIWHGDGSWVCITADGSPVPTIRLENFRDGLEDLWYAKILEEKLRAVESENLGVKGDVGDWVERAKAALAVPREVMDTMTNYTDDPAVLYRWRDEMADLIDESK